MTQFLIITSNKDAASRNIKDKFIISNNFKFERHRSKWHNNQLYKLESFFIDKTDNRILDDNEVFLGLTNERLIFLNDLKLDQTDINPDILIFASRHSSKSGKPALLVHTTGNWKGDIRYGGSKKIISKSSALLLREGYLSLIEHSSNPKLRKFSIDIEVTHHGPTDLDVPLIFMELGSDTRDWNISAAGQAVAKAIISTITRYSRIKEDSNLKIGVGFGGTHYAPQFQKLIRKHDIAVSFICPKYFIRYLDQNCITQMIEKNKEPVDFFLLDWKGLNSKDKDHLMPLLEDFDIPIKKTKDF
ncbi:MAG: D-tyrosyl-tRNA(Tyr) deacylase [Promethearchaeota archaeon]|nr:MAG: D-tyrosyl-tRNA(Tyr) deacylase [Candidatus Lokiarchaeota archaeon]